MKNNNMLNRCVIKKFFEISRRILQHSSTHDDKNMTYFVDEI